MLKSKRLFQAALGGMMAGAAISQAALASPVSDSLLDHPYTTQGCNGGCNGSCNGNCASQPDPKPDPKPDAEKPQGKARFFKG